MNQIQTLNNIQLLLVKGENKQAENLSRKLVTKYPNNGHAHLFLGMSIKESSCFEFKKNAFENAKSLLKIDGNAQFNIGNYYLEAGEFFKAIECYQNAIKLTKNEKYYLSLGDVYRFNGSINEQIFFYEKLKYKPELTGWIANIWLSIIYYRKGDLNKMASLLIDSKSIMLLKDIKSEPFRIYWNYLALLLRWHNENKIENSESQKVEGLIHVIGESHSLSTHGVHVNYKKINHQCIAHWIAGCKQYHFSVDLSNNKYKEAVAKVIEGLNNNDKIMFTIGEIDCRQNSGILKYVEKNPDKNINDVINKTVNDYLDFINKISKNKSIIISGVPASNLQRNKINNYLKLENNIVYLIPKFNEILKNKSIEYGFEFLDIYSLTTGQDSLASGEFHIDDYHLKPSAIQFAFSDYLYSPV